MILYEKTIERGPLEFRFSGTHDALIRLLDSYDANWRRVEGIEIEQVDASTWRTVRPLAFASDDEVQRLVHQVMHDLGKHAGLVQGRREGADNARVAVRNELIDQVAKAVVENGVEHDYCESGMAEFLAEAFSISKDVAFEHILAHVTKTVHVTITCEVTGAEYDTITENEAREFIEAALAADEVSDVNVEVSVD